VAEEACVQSRAEGKAEVLFLEFGRAVMTTLAVSRFERTVYFLSRFYYFVISEM
jgi:hypothetical protein